MYILYIYIYINNTIYNDNEMSIIYMNKSIFKMFLMISCLHIANLYVCVYVCTLIKIGLEHLLVPVVSFVLYHITVYNYYYCLLHFLVFGFT